jgi:hypothetical protein
MKESIPGKMDHRHIEEFDVASRYLLGRLAPEDESAFEEHFVDCPECLDRLEHARRFQAGLAAAVSAFATGGRPPLRASARPAWGALAVAAGIILCAGLAAVTARMLTLRRELARAAVETAAVERQYEESRRQTSDLRKQVEERSHPAPLPATLPVFALSLVRSGAADAGAPPLQIMLPAAPPPWVVLLLDIPETPYPSYRATVAAASGHTVWQQGDLSAASPGELAVAVQSAALPAGDYILQLEGRKPAGDFPVLGRYRFRVVVRR